MERNRGFFPVLESRGIDVESLKETTRKQLKHPMER